MDADRVKRSRDRARDHGLYFCIVCDEPIRGKTFYNRGKACCFGCALGADLGELREMEDLQPCQERALQSVRDATKSLHEAALPRLRHRMRDQGFQSNDLDDTLEWVRDRAPIIIHVDLASYGLQLARDTHYRNQFETNVSNGTLCHETRAGWEGSLFNAAYADACPEHRCKYGVLNVTNDPEGVRKCRSYGSSYFQLRNVRLRTTFAANDSAGISIEDIATVDYYAHVLEKYSDAELRATVEVATGRALGRDSEVIMNYKEAQIHGDVCLAENVELIMVHPSMRGSRHADMLRQLSERCRAQIVWMEGDGGQVGDQDGDSPSEGSSGVEVETWESPLATHGRTITSDTRSSLVTSPAVCDGFSEDDLRKAIEASCALASEEKLLAETEAEALELALALSTTVCNKTCSNGCGRSRAEGYSTCCRTCTETSGARHGPTCEAVHESLASTCRNGCGLPLVANFPLCARCLEQEELDKAIQASKEDSSPRQLEFAHDNGLVDEADSGDKEDAVADTMGSSLLDVCASSGALYVLKAKLNDDIRRLQVSWPTSAVADAKFQEILEGVQTVFGLESSVALALTYKDDTDGDFLTLAGATVEDFLASQSGALRIFVKIVQHTDMLSKSLHAKVDETREETGRDTSRMICQVQESVQAMASFDKEINGDKLLGHPHESECLLQETSDDFPRDDNTADNINLEHFIGQDLSNWDDFEHVTDPLEEWYDDPSVVILAANERDDDVGGERDDGVGVVVGGSQEEAAIEAP